MDKMRLLALALLLGCGGKNKPDCDAYATKYADAIGADPSRRATVIDGEKRACESGRITPDQIKCVNAARSESDIRACMGVSTDVKQEPAPGARISVVGVEGGSVKPIDQMPAEQKRWLDELQRRLNNCEPPAGEAAFAVTVTYTADKPTVDASAAPEPLRGCIERMFTSAKPHAAASVDFDTPITFQIKTR